MFPVARNAEELSAARENRTIDIVKRLGAISPHRIHLRNHPLGTPITVFNPALAVLDETVKLYARIILGYFLYVSAVIKIEFPIEDLYTGTINMCHYPGDIVVHPSIKYDVWGVEDPRVTIINNKLCMVYAGRTINYFNPHIRKERTLPILATMDEKGKWAKVCVFVLRRRLRSHVISDKDAFLVPTRSGDILLFHRPHMDDEEHYLVISKVPREVLDLIEKPTGTIKEIEVTDTKVILQQAPFEIKLGWASPPIEVEPDTFLVLIHGIDREIECYRVFAALIKYDKDEGPRPIAVTPYYIMEPKTVYEVFGDRPYTVFPCGMWKIDEDRALISYGAADSSAAIGEISISELMSHLEKTRIE